MSSLPEAFRKLKQKARTSTKEWKWHRGIVVHPLSESQWNRSHFSMRKWKSEKHKKLGETRRGLHGPRCHWRLLAGYRWQVESMRLVTGCSWIMMKNWGHCMGCMPCWQPTYCVLPTEVCQWYDTEKSNTNTDFVPAAALTKRDCEFIEITRQFTRILRHTCCPESHGAVRWDHVLTSMPSAE